MITYKPIIIQGGRRRDGTWPVKIRVTFKGVTRRLPTTLVCTDADLTRSGKIKNATVLEKAGELITRMRDACADLSPFTIDAWTVDDVVAHIRARLSSEQFRLDFFSFAQEVISGKIPHTKAYYQTALNAFAAYLGKDAIDVNAITRRMLLDFSAKIGEVKAGRHLAKLSYIYRCAREQYNDEDAGLIRIPRQPFTNLPRIQHLGKGQQPLSRKVMQQLIDTEPENEAAAVAIAAFLCSFGLIGANLVDMYDAKAPQGGVWSYHRHKTGTEAKVRIEPEIGTFLGILQAGDGKGLAFPALRRWSTPDTATHNVNKWLRRWAERNGVEPFTFYAARHTWSTEARKLGIELATIDEALAHKGDLKMARVYVRQNWDLAWEANRKVLGLFSWDKNRTKNEDTDGK